MNVGSLLHVPIGYSNYHFASFFLFAQISKAMLDVMIGSIERILQVTNTLKNT